jgi:hypothetical protein
VNETDRARLLDGAPDSHPAAFLILFREIAASGPVGEAGAVTRAREVWHKYHTDLPSAATAERIVADLKADA